jgi:hypothetical protein
MNALYPELCSLKGSDPLVRALAVSELAARLPAVLYRRRCDVPWTLDLVSGDSLATLGRPPGALEGQVGLLAALIHPDDWNGTRCMVGLALAADRAFDVTYRVVGPAGTVRWVRDLGTGQRGPGGRVVAVSGLLVPVEPGGAAARCAPPVLCGYCRQVRDPDGHWHVIETYLLRRHDLSFSHGVCPTCARWVDVPELDR